MEPDIDAGLFEAIQALSAEEIDKLKAASEEAAESLRGVCATLAAIRDAKAGDTTPTTLEDL